MATLTRTDELSQLYTLKAAILTDMQSNSAEKFRIQSWNTAGTSFSYSDPKGRMEVLQQVSARISELEGHQFRLARFADL